MTASLLRANKRHHIKPTRPSRDLVQIAELIEVAFADRLDASGRSTLREMKTIGRFYPVVWLFDLLEIIGLGLMSGYVWRDQGHVVGNVSMERAEQHPDLGRGWILANVATDPDYRRQGIAQALLIKALEHIKQKGDHWAMLQVEADNEAAIRLYEGLGFFAEERLTHWKTARLRNISHIGGRWPVRLRRRDEVEAELDLIFRRARRGGMRWTHSLQRSDLKDSPFAGLGGLPEGRQRERWVIEKPGEPGYLWASMWVGASSWRRAKLNLFVDPQCPAEAQQALIQHVLSRPIMQDRDLRLEMDTTDAGVYEQLRTYGFRQTRTLIQMRCFVTR